MASLEPPVPAIAADDFDESIGTTNHKTSVNRFGRWKRTVGLLMLAIVVFLWTASSFLASSVLADATYDKPFFITYINTAFFIIPLLPTLAIKYFQHPEELQQWQHGCKAWLRSWPARIKRIGSLTGRRARQSSISDSQELLLGASMDGAEQLNTKDFDQEGNTGVQLSIWATTILSFEFCMIWFVANYAIAASLRYTTVASCTILASTSSVFTLIFGVITGVEGFTLRKLTAILASLAGIILISSQDLSGSSSDEEHRGDFPQKSLRELAIGDTFAFLSAIAYGIYAVFLKKRIADESQVSMPLFFGLIGLVNIILLWPGFFILHWTGAETFELPPSGSITYIILANSLASLVADLAWAYAVVLTSPIVVTIGLSLSIPLSLLGELVLNSQTSTALYWIGAVVVVASFVIVSYEGKKDEQAQRFDTTSAQTVQPIDHLDERL